MDGRRIDSDFRRDRKDLLLVYMAVIPLARAIPLVPAEDGDKTVCSTPLRFIVNDMAVIECIDAEECGEL